MNNNDILIGLRDALDIKRTDMVEIFKHGGIDLTEEEVLEMLMNTKEIRDGKVDIQDDTKEIGKCDYATLESFLNGFIIFKRGKQEPKPGQPERPPLTIQDSRSVNNVMLKKLKIALSLSNEDMVDIFEEAGVAITKGELTTFFRKEGHKHYKRCNDKHANNFLKGLANMDLG